ncbi:MAG: hypothetical protein ACWGSQ_20450 [Longimicrobiales bacterium]
MAGRPVPEVDPALRLRLADLCAEGWEIWDRFDTSTGVGNFHPFVAADYEVVLEALLPFRAPGSMFLEWGSASGVITIMADLLGFRAFGVELDPELVRIARALALQLDSGATFTEGSFLPQGYRFRPPDGDGRLGTIGQGPSAYLRMGHALDEFDLVFAFPWGGEEPLMLDLIRTYGRRDALLLLYTVNDGVRVYRGGRRVG